MFISGKIERIYFAAKVVVITPAAFWLYLLSERVTLFSQFTTLMLVYLAVNFIIILLSFRKLIKSHNLVFLLSPVDAVFLYFVVLYSGGVQSQLHMPYYFLIALVSVYLPLRRVLIVAMIFSISYIVSVLPLLSNDEAVLVATKTIYIWLTAGLGYMISNNLKKSEQKLLKTLDTLNERTWELESSQLMVENMYETTRALSSMLDLKQLLDEVLTIADKLLQVKKCSVLLVESSTENLYVYAEINRGKKTMHDPPIPMSDLKAGNVKINSLPNFKDENKVDSDRRRQLLELPLISHGKVMGLLRILPRQVGELSEKEKKPLTVFATSTAIAIDNAKLHSKMQEMTIVDDLTGLYNYRYFRNKLSEEIRRADRYQQQLCILMIDVDHFKVLNDSQGHQTGNIILQEISSVVQHSVRDVDIVARFGGEEFIVILPQTGLEESVRIAERMRSQIAKSYFSNSKGDRDLKATISIGVAIYPNGVISSSQLLEKVDKAMYLAKNDGRNRVCVAPSSDRKEGKLVR